MYHQTRPFGLALRRLVLRQTLRRVVPTFFGLHPDQLPETNGRGCNRPPEPIYKVSQHGDRLVPAVAQVRPRLHPIPRLPSVTTSLDDGSFDRQHPSSEFARSASRC